MSTPTMNDAESAVKQASAHLYEFHAQNDDRWEATEIRTPPGLPASVWAEANKARLGMRDGTVYALRTAEAKGVGDPALPDDPLPNPHISITGETGSGKTTQVPQMLFDAGLASRGPSLFRPSRFQ